jgi:hypothetical protein
MEGNNGTNKILYHDIAAQTITYPPRVSLLEPGILDIENSMKGDSSDHITCMFPVV